MRAFKTASRILADAAVGFCLELVAGALGLLSPILVIPLWKLRWPPSISDYLEGPGRVRLRKVYQGKCPNIVVAESEIEFLYRALECPSCQFSDAAARSQGSPWCCAPEPPEIESFRCQTFRARALDAARQA